MNSLFTQAEKDRLWEVVGSARPYRESDNPLVTLGLLRWMVTLKSVSVADRLHDCLIRADYYKSRNREQFDAAIDALGEVDLPPCDLLHSRVAAARQQRQQTGGTMEGPSLLLTRQDLQDLRSMKEETHG